MKTRILLMLIWLGVALFSSSAQAQPQLIDCSCLATQTMLTATGCQAVIPDLCKATSCLITSAGTLLSCSQTPPPGTPVGPGTYAITVTLFDPVNPALPPQLCTFNFVLIAPATGCGFSLTCASNKTVECGTTWTFDPPTPVNPCVNTAGVPGNVTVTVLSTITNGTCPWVITRTWQAVDDCGNMAMCSQIVTVVDTTPPVANCNCLRDFARGLMRTTNCLGVVPDLCKFSQCFSDNCGPLTCAQTPPAGTVVGPGTYPVTVTVTDCAGNKASCSGNFVVVAPPEGCNTNSCCYGCMEPYPSTFTITVNTGLNYLVNPLCHGNQNTAGVILANVPDQTGLNTWDKVTASYTTDLFDVGLGGWGNPNQPLEPGVGFILNNPGPPFTLTFTGCEPHCPPRCPKTNELCLVGNTGSAPGNSTWETLFGTNCPPLCGSTVSIYNPLTGGYDDYVFLNGAWSPSTPVWPNGTSVFVSWHANTNCLPCEPSLAYTLNTGTAVGGGLLPTGALEQNWINITAPGGPTPMVVADTNLWPIVAGPWVGPNSTSAWVSPTVFNDGPSGWYTNRVIFRAPCTNVCLRGRIASDDDGYLFVNGMFVSGAGFTSWSNVNHCADFVKGPNVIEFVVHNAGGPTGFRTELEFWTQCCCETNVNVWNTGFDNNGTVALAAGVPDPNWTLVSFPAGGCNGPVQVLNNAGLPGAWMPNGPNSTWIGPALFTANCAPGVYHYQHRFVIPCTQGASIAGQFVADDVATLVLNGVQQATTVAGNYATWSPVNITSGFVASPNVNVLDLYVTNAIIYTGFRAELTNVFNTCCSNCDVSITCPANTNINSCSIVAGKTPVYYNLPTAASSCGDTPTVVCTPPSGSLFMLGTTIVNCTATDAQGDTASCSFTVTVVGVPPPVITCPTDLDVISTCGQPCTVVNYPTPLVTGGALVGCSPPPGFCFPIGTTTVTCLATNICNEQAVCTFSIYVEAVPPPVITCPANITVNSACGQACVVVNYLAPVVTGGTLVGCSPPPGTCFPIGTTLVTCRAVNRCNDRVACTFSVTVLPFTLPCTPPPPNMALWLPFDETTGLSAQNLAGGNPGTLINGPVHQLASYVNNSLCFDGLNDYVEVTPYPAIQFGTGDFSIDAWVKPATLDSTIRVIVDHRAEINGQSTGYSLFLGGNNGLAFQIGDGNFINYPSTLTVPADGRWHLVAVTVNRTNPNGIRFYVDGVIDSVPRDPTPYPGSVTPPPGYPLRVSSRSSSLSAFFPGCIDEVELFRRALTSSEIAAIYNAGPNGKCHPGISNVVPPLLVHCPGDLTILTCSNSATAYFKATASGNLGPIVCVPPSGTVFPIGTNTVTCTVSNICGATASCSFHVIVKSYGPLSPIPTVTYWAGLPDNFALPVEPSPQTACMVTAFAGYPFWKGFDATATDTLFGHRFTGLPNNIVKAELVVRMKPGNDIGADNDGIFVGLPTCSFASFLWSASIKTLPGAGGNWMPGHPATTFTLNLGALNPALLAHMNTAQRLDVVIHDDTTVDYMQLRLWLCPPPKHGIGIPYELVGGATAAIRPDLEAVPVGPALCVFPNPNLPATGITLQPGSARAFTFTTELSFDAPEGASLDLALPPDPENPDGTTLLSFHRKSGPKGYCIKTIKNYTDDPAATYRSIAIGSNGELFSSFLWDANDMENNVLMNINHQPGVTSVVVTVTFDCRTREVTLDFPHCVWTPDLARKGWDGCIYGNRPPGSLHGRLILTPLTTVASPPITELSVLATGLTEVLIDDPSIDAVGRKWGDGHVTLMKAYDDGEKLSYTCVADGGGVHTDLGHAASFELGIHHFEDGDIPTEEQLFRIVGGPIRGLTNRPTPPTIPLRLVKGPGGVDCSVDFSDLGATAVTVQLYDHGMLLGEGTEPGAGIAPESPLILDHWPDRIGQLNVNGVLRLTSREPFTISGISGDEIRIIPELPPGTELPEFISGLECLASEGMDNLIYGLQRTSACPATLLNISATADGISLTWPGDGQHLLGAETVNGPWYDLGVTSPVQFAPNAPMRFFQLKCD